MSTPTAAAARRRADAPGGDVPAAVCAARRAWRYSWGLLALCVWVSGCGDPDPGPQPAIDMAPDVGPDTGADALPDAMPDEGPACETGFQLERGVCVDVDECADAQPCDMRVDCINLSGGFTCGACPPGFSGNGLDGCVLDCPDGEHDGGDGVCRADDGCAPGYVLDEPGDCVPIECPDGQHFDGLDACAPEGVCAEGFEPDRRGDCIATLCAPDEHDDGTGACAPFGECAPGHLLDDGGDCQPLTCPADDALEPNDSPDDATQLPDGALDAIACDEADVFVLAPQDGCAAIVELRTLDAGPTLAIIDSGGALLATGAPVDGGLRARADVADVAFAVVQGRGAYRISTTYAGHDGGDGACVDRGTCSVGWALEGDACTRCAQGYRDGGDGRCVPYGQCAEGYAITLLDECRAVAECPEGLVDNGRGQCQGQCAAGFQPGGGEPSLCLPLGDCQAIARDRGDGACAQACAGGTVAAGKVCVEDHGCETDDPLEQAEAGGPVDLSSGQPRFGVVCEGDADHFQLDLARGCDARVWLRFDPEEGRLAVDAPANPDLIAVDALGGQRLIIDGAPGALTLRVRGVDGAAARYALRVDTDPDQHDGGDGTCAPRGECAPDYRADDDGDCTLCAAGAHDGGGGACVPRGECAEGFHDGGDGTCVEADRCSDGFHDGGDGSCVAADRCVDGFHDGGDGACIEADRCIAGFHDGNGADPGNPCRPVGACVRGWHGGGDGVCVPAEECSPDHINRGDGGCTLNDALATECAEGYDFVFADGGRCDCGLGTRDGGDGRCTPYGACSPGFHPSRPDGPCAPVGACDAGHHATPWGDCRATALCDIGQRDDGIGRCVALGAGCVDGFFDRGGACAAAPFCAPGAHDGGDGLCVQSDRCAAGFRSAPAGCVLDAREPADCSAFDFDDARPIESGPPAGGAICGLAADTLRFAVDHSCGFDVRLVADDPDQLLDVQLFDDARAPLDRAEAIGGRARIWIPAAGPRAGFIRVIPVASAAEPVPYRLDLVRDPSRCAPCPPDSTSDGAGRCIPPADGCAPGHHDGGAGACVPLDRCSPGFGDGGDGLCAPFDECGAGHYLDQSLSCAPLRQCPDGQRDDGANMCAVECAEAVGYHEGGDGTCVARPFCAPGYADDLGGTCIERQPGAVCAAGAPDASGLCLAGGCPDGSDLTTGPLDAEPLAVDLDGVTRTDGSLCPGDPGDWYAVAVRGSALLARLRFDHGTNDMTLRILDEGGALLAEATSGDDDEVTAIPPTDGAVIVEVTGDGRNASYRLDLIRPAE